jgi:hypothetical protein
MKHGLRHGHLIRHGHKHINTDNLKNIEHRHHYIYLFIIYYN